MEEGHPEITTKGYENPMVGGCIRKKIRAGLKFYRDLIYSMTSIVSPGVYLLCQ